MTGKVAKVETLAPSPSPPEMKHVSTCTSVGTVTEPDCLGPCEPGTSVTLEGIVWQETEGGVLVVNVTWRGKTYVGTLLDCTKHDWAPPRFCESPTSDIEAKTNKVSRAKRSRGSVVDTNLDLRNVPSKLRNGKGRRTANSGFTVPASPVKCDTANNSNNGKRKTRLDLELSPASDSKNGKKNRSQSRNTPTPGTPTGESPAQSFSTWIECPEPNCSKKYKNINGLKYHQKAHRRSAHDGPIESSSKIETDSMELDQSKEPTNASDGEENSESTSVPPSPSFKFVLKGRLGVVDSAAANNDHAVDSSEEVSQNEANDDGKLSAVNSSKDDLNSTDNLSGVAHAPSSSSSSLSSYHNSATSSASSTSPTPTSGKATIAVGNPTSSTHSATFLVPATCSQNTGVTLTSTSRVSNFVGSRISDKVKIRGEKSCNNDKFYRVTPGPSGLSISVSPVLSSSSGSSPKHIVSTPLESIHSKSGSLSDSNSVNPLKHKKKKKDKKKKKEKDRDREKSKEKDRESEKKFASVNESSPSANNTSSERSKNPQPSVPEDKNESGSQKSKSDSSSLQSSSFIVDGEKTSKNSSNEQEQSILDNASPMDTSGTQVRSDEVSENVNSESTNIENVQSPAYSDISDANDTDTEMKTVPMDKSEDKTGIVSVGPVDVANFSPSSNFGIYPFFNQPSYMLPVGQPCGQKPNETGRISDQPSMETSRSTQSPTQNSSQSTLTQSQCQNKSLPSSSSQSQASTLTSRVTSPSSTRLSKSVITSDAKKGGCDFPRNLSADSRKNISHDADRDDQGEKQDDNNLSHNKSISPETNNESSSQGFSSSHRPFQYSSYPYMQGLFLDPSYMHAMSADPHYRQQFSKMVTEQGEKSDPKDVGGSEKRLLGLDMAGKNNQPSSGITRSNAPSSRYENLPLGRSLLGKDKMSDVQSNTSKDTIEVLPQLDSRNSNREKSHTSQAGQMLARSGVHSGSSFDHVFDKSKDDSKRYFLADSEKGVDEKASKTYLPGPPPLKRDEMSSFRDLKYDSSKSSSPYSSIVNPSQSVKIASTSTPTSVMSSVPSISTSSISSPKYLTTSSTSSISSTSSPSSKDSKKEKTGDDQEDRKNKVKDEGSPFMDGPRNFKFGTSYVKPTMETTGPPPPPTNSYYLPPQYLQHPLHSFSHMPFDPGHPLFRPGSMNSPVLGNPYSAPPPPSPYIHSQLRYHLGPPPPGPVDNSRPPASSPVPLPGDPMIKSSNQTGPSKSIDLLHPASPHYSSHHKIHELQDRAIMSPNVAGSRMSSPSGTSPNAPRMSLPSTEGTSTSSDSGSSSVSVSKGDPSRSPPPQRHLHTHHHTHVNSSSCSLTLYYYDKFVMPHTR